MIEVNKAAMEALEKVQQSLGPMKSDEREKFVLDENYGANTASLMPRAIKKLRVISLLVSKR